MSTMSYDLRNDEKTVRVEQKSRIRKHDNLTDMYI